MADVRRPPTTQEFAGARLRRSLAIGQLVMIMCTVSVRSQAFPASDRVTILVDMTNLRFSRAAPALQDEPIDTGGCCVPGCCAEATHKAPKSRDQLNRYVWFCLEHVREYNASWDYYAGMNESQIEAHRRQDVTWRRPTWPLGSRQTGGLDAGGLPFEDPFDLLRERAERRAAPDMPRSKTDEALDVLDLSAPVTADEIKARYFELVKRLHPDANGGDKTAEERLKSVNEAYATLKNGVGPLG